MNKKIIFATLAVLLVLVAIFVFGSNGLKNDSANSTSSLEEAPILGDKDDIQKNRPDNIADSAEKTEALDENESSAKPQENPKPLEAESIGISDISSVEYEEFMNMPSAEQQEVVDSFSSIDDFFDWYNETKKVYEQENPPVEFSEGVIDIGEIIEEKN